MTTLDPKAGFVCPRCHNRDRRYIGLKDGKPYCRRCLPFQGKEITVSQHVVKPGITLSLGYPLSENQDRVSKEVLHQITLGRNVFIHAVTGAGKTELVYPSMAYCLSLGGHVGFATPRKDVVIDLLPRIQEAFPMADVVGVYGGHNQVLEGDILCLTCHQLFRYPQYFDLLILDEIDAFPYHGDPLLESFFRRAVKGNYILLSATPTREDLKQVTSDNGNVVELFERYHHHALPVPVFHFINSFMSYLSCLYHLRRFLGQSKPVFVFVPTIESGLRLARFLTVFCQGGAFVSSQEELRKTDIQAFKAGTLRYLVTTSILERGVTVRDLQVIVFEADHPVYNAATLIQIAGRVGRKIHAETGEVLFLGYERTPAIDKAIETIVDENHKAGLV